MTLRLTVVCLGLGFSPAVLAGQGSKVDLKGDEAAIRALVGKRALCAPDMDCIAWSGAYKRPNVGSQKGEPFPQAGIGKRKNQKDTVKVQRLEVAASGDMAWEFSYGTLEYDVDETPSRHVSFETRALRVWEKKGGQWKVAAAFIRPLDVPFDHTGSRP